MEYVNSVLLLLIILKLRIMSKMYGAIKSVLGKISTDVDLIKSKLEAGAKDGLTAEEAQDILNIAEGIDLKVPEEEAPPVDNPPAAEGAEDVAKFD